MSLSKVSLRGLDEDLTNEADKALRDQEFLVEQFALQKNFGWHVGLVWRQRSTDWTFDLDGQFAVPSLRILLASCKVMPFITTGNNIEVVLGLGHCVCDHTMWCAKGARAYDAGGNSFSRSP